MLVIHPKDQTTVMLSTLYEGLEVQVIDVDCSTKEMNRLLHHVSPQERIMLLGHGSDKGLFFRPTTARRFSTELLSAILTLIICAGMEATLWQCGAMPTGLQKRKDCMDCLPE